MLPVVVAQSSSDGSAVSYVLPGFVGDVMLSYNSVSGQESKTMGMFHTVYQSDIRKRLVEFAWMAVPGESHCLVVLCFFFHFPP